MSAFVLQGDGKSSRNPDDYLRHFDALARTGLPIVLYLDKSLRGHISYPNVRVEYVTIQDIWMSNLGTKFPKDIVALRDTPDYLRIQNAKTEFTARVAAEGKYDRVAWIDTAATRLFVDPKTINKLSHLNNVPSNTLVIPGCWPTTTLSVDHVMWRFCGSFFVGDCNTVLAFDKASRSMARSLLPRLTWEVNVWAYMEAEGFPFQWYPADHNYSLLDIQEKVLPPSLVPIWKRMEWSLASCSSTK